jgi:hypothetical protein
MRIRAGVAPVAARLETSRYGRDLTSLRISDPEPSPQPHRDVTKRSFARALRYETWIDRGPTSSTAVQRSGRHVVYGGAARGSSGPWAVGTSFGTLRTSVARSRSFLWPSLATKVVDLQVFPAMARPGLEPGTPRSSAVARPVRSCAPWAIGTSFGTLRASVARSHSLGARRTGEKTGRFAGAFGDGETRTRTGDTTIFSRVLYQLSYLAVMG